MASYLRQRQPLCIVCKSQLTDAYLKARRNKSRLKPIRKVYLSVCEPAPEASRVIHLMGLTAMAGILLFSLIDASRVGLAPRFGLKMPD
jgi:hypothetical protein